MRRVLGGLRWLLVTMGIVLLTSITIDATTSHTISQSALGILARTVTQTTCPAGMVEHTTADRRFCIDVYEVSPS